MDNNTTTAAYRAEAHARNARNARKYQSGFMDINTTNDLLNGIAAALNNHDAHELERLEIISRELPQERSDSINNLINAALDIIEETDLDEHRIGHERDGFGC